MNNKSKISGRRQSLFLVFLVVTGINPVVKGSGMPQDTGFWTSASFVYHYEAGVANRISFQDVYAYSFPKQTEIALTVRFHLNENKGLGMTSFLARKIPGPFPWMKFQVEWLHLEYPDLYTGENQIAALIHFIPHQRISFMAGMAYRSPDLANKKMHSPFEWDHQMNEVNLLFNVNWIFIDLKKFRSDLFVGNYTWQTIHNPDHLMLGLHGSYRITDHIMLGMEIRSAVKGVSGFVFSVNEFQAETGIKIRF
jgi:hypothetical protein